MQVSASHEINGAIRHVPGLGIKIIFKVWNDFNRGQPKLYPFRERYARESTFSSLRLTTIDASSARMSS